MTDQETVLLVELAEKKSDGIAYRGMEDRGPQVLDQAHSRWAIDNALNAIRLVAQKAKAALDGIDASQRPDEAELEFGIKIGTEGGLIVAKGTAEFHITAKLIWRKKAEA